MNLNLTPCADPKATPDRESTDQSLVVERSRTDGELERGRATIAEDANEVVRTARTKADAVLETAREAADHKLKNPTANAALKPQRAREDAAVVAGRATEDRDLGRERLARSEALTELFRLERDQTDLYLLTERARSDEAVNTRDTFLAMVAHDLRTILQGIALTAEVLAQESAAEKGSKVHARAQTIQRSSARMNRLIGDLVDVAAIETGRPLVMPKAGELELLLREIDEGLRPSAALHHLTFTSEVIGRPPVAAFDHDRILQVLANLITNAIKYTPDGGRIALRIDGHEGMVRFSVRDTGEGIPADKLEAIFERFWQVERTDRRGLGLGLYISKSIIEGHGGKIWAESKPGEGAALFFTLPQVAPA